MANHDPLVDKLAAKPELFHPKLDAPMRRWFVERVLAFVRAGPAPHEDEGDATARLEFAKTAATSCDTLIGALTTPPWNDPAHSVAARELSIPVAYGAMGVHPDALLRLARVDYLTFVVKRRILTVIRMRDDVNSGTLFGYPPLSPVYSITNTGAASYWAGISAPDNSSQPNRYPFVLSDAGVQHPEQAFAALFKPSGQPNKVDLFDCAGTAMIVLTDALIESAADPAALALALNSTAPRYLTLDHVAGSSKPAELGDPGLEVGQDMMLIADAPAGQHVEVSVAFAWRAEVGAQRQLVTPGGSETVTVESVGRDGTRYTGKITLAQLSDPAPAGSRLVRTDGPPYHLITDPTPAGMFEQKFIATADLQIGDHVYVANHPLYRAVMTGAWSGEHSIVLSAPFTRLDSLNVTGHGLKPITLLAAFDGEMLLDLNRHLEMLRAGVTHQLTPTFPPAAVPVDTIAGAEKIKTALRERYGKPESAAVTVTCQVYKHPPAPYPIDLVRSSVVQTPAIRVMTFAGTVGGDPVPANDFFLIRAQRLKDDAVDLIDWSHTFTRVVHDSNVHLTPADQQYSVSYHDDTQENQLVDLSLYYAPPDTRDGSRRLSYDDVTDPVLGNTPGTVLVSRPRVVPDEDGSYRVMLRQKGALPTTAPAP